MARLREGKLRTTYPPRSRSLPYKFAALVFLAIIFVCVFSPASGQQRRSATAPQFDILDTLGDVEAGASGTKQSRKTYRPKRGRTKNVKPPKKEFSQHELDSLLEKQLKQQQSKGGVMSDGNLWNNFTQVVLCLGLILGGGAVLFSWCEDRSDLARSRYAVQKRRRARKRSSAGGMVVPRST